MAAQWLIALIIATAVQVAAYLILPGPKSPKPDAAKQSEAPTADAGKPAPVVFGTIRVKEINCLGWMDQSMTEYQVKV